MHLGISLLKDESTRYWDIHPQSATSNHLPDEFQLQRSIAEFMKGLVITEEEARKIEQRTRQQRHSPEWFAASRFRLTSSVFGEIFHRRPDTPPDALVVRLIE